MHKWVFVARRQNRYMYKREDVKASLFVEKKTNPDHDGFAVEYFIDKENRRRILVVGEFVNEHAELGLLEGTSAMVDVWKVMYG